ncbi:MAG: hypothetical protein SGARI_008265 [Bacillariaceae sp.]
MNLIGMLKCYGLNAFWMTGCLFGALLTVIDSFLHLDFALQHTRDFAHLQVERRLAQLTCKIFVAPVVVKGAEHLPQDNTSPAPVLIANHASQIDTACVYYLTPKIMYLSDHVFIDRRGSAKKKEGHSSSSGTSTKNLYIKSNQSIQEGTPMFFFPQGTRQLGERLPFKDGAFKVAKQTDAVLIPISVDIPLTAWNSWYPLVKAPNPVVLTVHPPIESKGKDIEQLKKESFAAIYSVLPDYTKSD